MRYSLLLKLSYQSRYRARQGPNHLDPKPMFQHGTFPSQA